MSWLDTKKQREDYRSEQLAQREAHLKSARDAGLKAVEEKRSLTEDEQAAVNTSLDAAKQIQDSLAVFSAVPEGEVAEASAEGSRSVRKNLGASPIESRNDDNEFEARFRKCGFNGNIRSAGPLGTGSTIGGEFVPQAYHEHYVEVLQNVDGVVKAGCEVINTSDNVPIKISIYDDTAQTGNVTAENVELAAVSRPVFGSKVLTGHMADSGQQLVSKQELLAAYDIKSWLGKLLFKRVAKVQNAAFTNGDGSDTATGILDATYGATASGVITTDGHTISYDDLVDLFNSVDSDYQSEGVWMFHQQTLGLLLKLSDDYGRRMWGNSDIAQSYAPTLLGRPWYINNSMPVPAANAKIILFGDVSAYKARLVGGIELGMYEDSVTAKSHQIALQAFQLFDGVLTDRVAVKTLACGASS